MIGDPYLEIAAATDFVDYLDGKSRFPVIVQIKDNTTHEALAKELKSHGQLEPAYAKFGRGFRFVTASVSGAGLQILRQSVHVERFEYAGQLRPSRMQARPGSPSGNLPDPATVLPNAQRVGTIASPILFGMIDSGCPFMHPSLTRRGLVISTRVRALWDQDPSPDFAGFSSQPMDFSYGAEVSRQSLDRAISLSQGDERACYDMVGYREMQPSGSHGSHCLGMMLGHSLRDPLAPSEVSGPEDVVFVQLPRALLFAPSRAALARHILDGLLWIASKRQGSEKLVISISRGSPLGPHDGSSIIETALGQFAALMGENRLQGIYVAAGNEFNSKLHLEVSVRKQQTAALTWRVPPASEMRAVVELWVPKVGAKPTDLMISIQSPDGKVLVHKLQQGQQVCWPEPKHCVVAVNFSAWAADRASLCLIRLAPTHACGDQPSAMTGDWTIRLTSENGISRPIHAYVGRVTPALGNPRRAQQSHFVWSPTSAPNGYDPNTLNTLQGFATAQGVSAVGAYVGAISAMKAAKYTSAGPSRNQAKPGPKYSVRTEECISLRGRRSIGNYRGTTFRMDGTSVAAPLAACAMAINLQSVIQPPVSGVTPKNPVQLGERMLNI